MIQRFHTSLRWSVGSLLVVFLLLNSPALQAGAEDLAKKYPGFEGLYAMPTPDSGTVALQVYFKDGTLRTIKAGEGSSTVFFPAEGQADRFVAKPSDKGTSRLEVLKDEAGQYTRFRLVNEALKLDATGVRQADLDDAKADPVSPSDRLGYFERHYRKIEHRVPMRDGVRRSMIG